jgi:hypothetical protein
MDRTQRLRAASLVGLTLVTTGGLIVACGIGTSCVAMAKSFRRWLMAQQIQQAAEAIAARSIAPAKAATASTSAGKRQTGSPSVVR